MGNNNLNLTEDRNGNDIPVPALGTSVVVAYDASALSSLLSTYADSPNVVVRITTTTDAFVTSGAAPTAVADGTNHFIPLGIPQDLVFPANHKLAFIKATVAGNAYVTVLK